MQYKKIRIIGNGLLTGLFLQLAIGPVFFFIVNLVLQRSIYDGFSAVCAIILVDCLFISLALLGVGKLLEREKIKRTFGILSSVALIIFGIVIIKGVIFAENSHQIEINSTSYLSSFIATFILTVSSPLTIVFFTSVFTTKAFEYDYTKKQLFIFGSSVAVANLLFLSTTVLLISLFKASIPASIIKILNFIVGLVLIFYGIIRIVKIVKIVKASKA